MPVFSKLPVELYWSTCAHQEASQRTGLRVRAKWAFVFVHVHLGTLVHTDTLVQGGELWVALLTFQLLR